MPEPGRVMEEAEALLRRVSPEGRRLAQRARERRFRRRMRVAQRLFLATVAVVIGMIAWGLIIGPIGTTGVMIAAVVGLIAWIAIIAAAREPAETPRTLAAADLPLLPSRTEAWLQRQRPALPAPAQRLADSIGERLETLAPQLATLDPREPAAAAIRKLMAEELPELVDGYRRVPEPLRASSRDGLAPDKQLVDGLNVVDSELARMSQQLANGDLTKLATQGRYLELKYRGDPAGDAG